MFKIWYVNNAILNSEGALNSNISVDKYLSYWLTYFIAVVTDAVAWNQLTQN